MRSQRLMQSGQHMGLTEKLACETCTEETFLLNESSKLDMSTVRLNIYLRRKKKSLGVPANLVLAYLWVCDHCYQAAVLPCFVKGWTQVLPVQLGNYRIPVYLKPGSGLHPLVS